MTTGGQIRLEEGTGNGDHVGFKAPDTEIDAEVIWTLPSTDGATGQVMVTDGNKNLSWASVTDSGEATARENADSTLQANIDAEITARTNADSTLTTNLNSEITARENADSTLTTNLNSEITARENADSTLQANINEKVSSQWTTSGSDIYYSTGKVSVGVASPDSSTTTHLKTTTADQALLFLENAGGNSRGRQVVFSNGGTAKSSVNHWTSGGALLGLTANGYFNDASFSLVQYDATYPSWSMFFNTLDTTTNDNFSISHTPAGGATSTYFKIDKDGNIGIELGHLGIGTTPSATYPLHIVKDAAGQQAAVLKNASTNASAASAWIASNGTNEVRLLRAGTDYSAYGSFTSNDGALYSDHSIVLMADNASGVIKFATGGNSEKVRIDTNGNFGIGTTLNAWSDLTAVQVKNSSLSGFGASLYLAQNAYYNGSNWTKISDSYAAKIQADDGMLFSVAGSGTGTITWTDTIKITNDGKMGIGYTSPLSKFEIRDDCSGNETGQLRIRGVATDKQLHFGYNTTSDYGFINCYYAGVGYKPFILQPDGGSVGIGTVNPTGAKQEIVVTAAAQVTALKVRSDNTRLTQNDETSIDIGWYNTAYYGGRISGYIEDATGVGKGGIKFYTAAVGNTINATPSMILDASSNVIIGTSSPIDGAKLSIDASGTVSFASRGNSSASTLLLRHPSSNVLDFSTAGASQLFTWSINGTEQMRLNASGYLGLGTSTLGSDRLTIQGSASNPQIRLIRGDDTGQGMTLYAGGGEVYYTGINTTSAPYPAHIWQSTNNSTTKEYMRIDQSGNLGLGTSTPGTYSTIAGTTPTNFAITGTAGAKAAMLSLETDMSVTGQWAGVLVFNNNNNSSNTWDSVNARNIALIGAYTETSDSNGHSDSGGNLAFKTKSEGGAITDRMVINSLGHIGIGTIPSSLGAGGSNTLLQVHNAGAPGGYLALSTAATSASSQAGVIEFGTTGASTRKRCAALYGNLEADSSTNAIGGLLIYTEDGSSFAERARITKDGNLGIGISSSIVGKIHSQPASNAIGLIVDDGSYGFYQSVGNTLNFNYNAAANTDAWINYNGYQNSTTYYRGLIIGDGKQGSIVRFDATTGHVGIGTSGAPSYRLDVNGGIVRAKQSTGIAQYAGASDSGVSIDSTTGITISPPSGNAGGLMILRDITAGATLLWFVSSNSGIALISDPDSQTGNWSVTSDGTSIIIKAASGTRTGRAVVFSA